MTYPRRSFERLVSLVGPGAGLLMYTGMRMNAAEALENALVDRIFCGRHVWYGSWSLEMTDVISAHADGAEAIVVPVQAIAHPSFYRGSPHP